VCAPPSITLLTAKEVLITYSGLVLKGKDELLDATLSVCATV
jgi:hypothetical protein